MGINYYIRTKKDKIELIQFYRSFRVGIKTFINKNLKKWIDEIGNEELKSDSYMLIRTEINELHDKKIRGILLSILEMPAETEKDIQYILKMACIKIRSIDIHVYNDGRFLNKDLENGLFILLFKIFPYKMNASHLYYKVTHNAMDEEFLEQSNVSIYLNRIYEELKRKRSTERNRNIAIYINHIYQLFSLSNEYALPFLIYLIFINPLDKIEIGNILKEIDKKSIFLNISDIKNNDRVDMTKPIKNITVQCDVPEKIGEIISGCILFGDNIFKDYTDEEKKNFLYQIRYIDSDVICEYIKEYPENIFFSLPTNDLAFLTYEFHYKTCMIKTKKSIKYLIMVTIGDIEKPFILYKRKNQENKIYGISISRKNRDIREQITFEIPSTYKYEIDMERVVYNKL